jgi:hypothetical protein
MVGCTYCGLEYRKVVLAVTPADRINIDQALKRVLLHGHDGFLALVAPELTWQRDRSPELPAIARLADIVWEVERADGSPGLLHIEIQTRAAADIGERVAEYAIRLWRRDHMPIRSIVIVLRPPGAESVSPFVIDWMGQDSLRCNFGVVRLWELPAGRALNAPYVELWPLTCLMEGATVGTVLQAAEQIAASPLPLQERSDLTSLLVLLAGLRLPPNLIREALGRSTMLEDLLKESSATIIFEELGMERAMERAMALVMPAAMEQAMPIAMEQAMPIAMEQAMPIAMEQAMPIAMEQAMRESTRIALQGRYGALDESILHALSMVNEVQLADTLAHIAVDSIDQTLARLTSTE